MQIIVHAGFSHAERSEDPVGVATAVIETPDRSSNASFLAAYPAAAIAPVHRCGY